MIEPGTAIDPMTAVEERLPGHWLSEEEQVAFFDSALEATREAERRTTVIERTIELAGTRIALRFAGAALQQRFFPALSHLEVPPGSTPDLVLHCWDSGSAGIPLPPPPCRKESFTDRGDIWGMASPRIRSAFHWSEFSVNLLDLSRRIGIFWVQQESRLPYWTMSSPLRSLLHWWMEANGGHLLHAAAVGGPEGALLITGKGGVGKSTTALTCLEAKMQLISDDYLVVTLDPVPTVHCLYATAKLDPIQATRFPGLAPHLMNPDHRPDEKAVIRLYPAFEPQLPRSLPLLALATPVFVPQPETRFGPVDRLRLERAAEFTTMAQLPHAGQSTHEFVKRLVASVPGFELGLGLDLTGIPDSIRALLALPLPELSARASAPEPRPTRGPDELISVIIPVHNGTRFVEEAVGSILRQGYEAIEIIIVDDGSTDDLASVVRRLPVEVRCFRQDNEGPASARNRGIKDVSGELIAFLDVDDLWPDGRLELLCQALLADAELDVVYGLAQVTRSAAGAGVGEFLGSPRESYPNYIGSGLYRRRAFQRVGLFDPELRYGEDSDWFKRAEEAGLRTCRLDDVTLYVRRHGENMTRGKSLVERNLLRVLKKQMTRGKLGKTGGT